LFSVKRDPVSRSLVATKTVISGLSLGKYVQIRCRPFTKSGPWRLGRSDHRARDLRRSASILANRRFDLEWAAGHGR
jgi:hypothetical protein